MRARCPFPPRPGVPFSPAHSAASIAQALTVDRRDHEQDGKVRVNASPCLDGVATRGVVEVPSEGLRSRRAATASLLALVLTGCISEENSISESEEQELLERFESVAPDLRKFDIYAGGNGFTIEYNLSADACPQGDVTVSQARAQLRKIAQVVWNHAETSWEKLTIGTHCRADYRDEMKSTSADGLELKVAAAGARQLWGEPTEVEHDSESSPVVQRNAKVGAGAWFEDLDDASSFSLSEDYEMYGPEPRDGSRSAWWDVHVPHRTSEQDRKADLDQIIAKLWREHPGRLAGIGIHAVELGHPDWDADSESQQQWEKNRPEWRSEYSAEQLQDRFGSRAADLPQ